jgi:hypothetical protein
MVEVRFQELEPGESIRPRRIREKVKQDLGVETGVRRGMGMACVGV